MQTRMKHTMGGIFFLAFILNFLPSQAAELQTTTPRTAVLRTLVLHDAWYTMQAGSTAWGYYHEFFELRDNKYFYRYEMTKREANYTYHENLGALSQLDLTPVTFNLKKSGNTATEIINGNYVTAKHGGNMKIDIDGSRKKTLTRSIPKGGMLDSFFPLWIKQHWLELKPGKKITLQLFGEDAGYADFKTHSTRLEVKKMDTNENCLLMEVYFHGLKYLWCASSDGMLVYLNIGNRMVTVKRVKGEKEARAFIHLEDK